MKKSNIRRLSVFLVICLLFTPCTAFASENTDNNIQPRGMYIRTFVRYDESAHNVNWTYQYVGSVSGDNTGGSSPLTVSFAYGTTDSIDATLGTSVTGTYEVDAVIAKMSASATINASLSRAWSQGTQSGATYPIQPGKRQQLSGYIPGITSSGSLVYKVCMSGYENNYWYENKPVSNAFAPAQSHIHFVVSNI